MTSDTLISRMDQRLERWSERLNPIVVKETRQALKSRAFPLAFLVMLALCWGVSIFMLAEYGDAISYGGYGPQFFTGYYAVLLFAICFVVPGALFRGVTAEFDGQTYEMLAITTLSPRKIVFGKLKAALVQMGAYYSAAAPFLCFTYMLEGVSIPGICVALIVSVLAGLSASMGAMMLGSLAKQSAWQVICLLISLGISAVIFGISLAGGSSVAGESVSAGGFAGLCAGFGCFGYVFLFFSLLTMGVSIAQFTPTIPPPGLTERDRQNLTGTPTPPRPDDRADQAPPL